MSSLQRWRELSPYLDQALELEGDERAVWVASIRERNPQLGILLESMLDEHRVVVQEKFLEEAELSASTAPSVEGQRARGHRCFR